MSDMTDSQRKMKKVSKSIFSLSTAEKIGSLALIVVVWQALVEIGIGGMKWIPSPLETFAAFIPYLPSEEFATDMSISIMRITAGFVLGVVTGIPLGLFMGWKRHVKYWTFPTFEILRPIPPLAWIPLAVVMFTGIEESIIFIIWTGAFFPIVLNTMLGVTSIPKNLQRSCLSLGVNSAQMLRHVIIPGAIPAIITGMVLGMGITWDQLVAAEMLAGGTGVGYQLWYYYIIENFPKVLMFMLLIGGVGYGFSTVIRVIGGRYMKWSN